MTNAITPNDGAKLYAMSLALNGLMPLNLQGIKNEVNRWSVLASQRLGQLGTAQTAQAIGAITSSTLAGMTSGVVLGAAMGTVGGVAVCTEKFGFLSTFFFGPACAVAGATLGVGSSVIDVFATAHTEVKRSLCVLNKNGQQLIIGTSEKANADRFFGQVESVINSYKRGSSPQYEDTRRTYDNLNITRALYGASLFHFTAVGVLTPNTDPLARFFSAALVGAIPTLSSIEALLVLKKGECQNIQTSPAFAQGVSNKMIIKQDQRARSNIFGITKQSGYTKTFSQFWVKPIKPTPIIKMTVASMPVTGSIGEYKITASSSGITVGETLSYMFNFGDGKKWLSQQIGPYVAMNVINHTYTKTGSFPVKVKVTLSDGRTKTATTTVLVNQAPVIPVLSYLQIKGGSWVNEGTTLALSATAIFSDKSTKAVAAVWSVDVPPGTAVISASGVITARQVTENKVANVTAKYVFGNITVYARKVIVINDLNLPVVDNIKPVVTPPTDLILPASSNQGVPVSNPAVVAFLNGATVTDNIDTGLVAHQGVSVLPVMYPPGITTIKFIATDRAGNIGTATAKINVKLADLSIFNSNGQTTVVSGSAVNYTIAVKNNGVSDVIGAKVTDTLPPSLTGATWVCVASTGSSCTASGTGNIADAAVNLLKGGTTTYTLTATLSAAAIGNLVSTVTITAPVGITDPNTSNNSAADTDLIVGNNANIVAQVNALSTGKYGFNYGSSANKTSLKLSFQGNGKDRLLHVQSYDIDFPDEVAVYLNGTLLGHLIGKNNALGKDSLWMLPAGLQVTGNNIIEFRERVAGWKWGVTRLGIFDAGKFFGNVKIGLAGGDIGHKNGVEFHFQGGVDRTIELAGWDSDFNNEIGLKLNGKALADLPKGPNNKATPTYHLLLTKAQLKAGDNIISVNQQMNLAYNWGIAFKAVRDAAKGMGVISTIAKSKQQVNGAVYLIPASAATQLSLTYYDVDFAKELSLLVNGKNVGNANVTANNKWGTTAQTLTLSANKLNVVEINNTFNPPNRYFWGVKFTGLSVAASVADKEAPVITLSGGNMSIALGAVFTDPGSTVTDNVNKNLKAVVTGKVSTSVVGIYTITYNATDAAGNKAKTMTRIVKVGAIITAQILKVNGMDTVAKYGFNYGSSANKTSLKLSFNGNGKDRLLHVQSYDIDFPDEVAVYLNGTLLGHLTGKNNALGKDSLWMLSAGLQVTGSNIIEFRERVAGWKWGVTRLGIFDVGTFFGNVTVGLAGGDIGHKNGVEFHFQGGADRTIELAGWDSDFNNEIGLKLNGKTLANLPKGPNNKATPTYHLLLTKAQLKTGDNMISVNQRMNLAYNWGIAFKAVRDASKGMGVISTIAKSKQQVNGAVYLIPASAATKLSLTYYDVDFASELSLLVNGKNVGNASVTANNQWGTTAQTLTLPANRLNVVEINNTFNPPNRYFWGVKFTGLQ